MTCNHTPTEVLDRIEATLIGRRSRVVGTMSLALHRHLRDVIDDLAESDREDGEALADELAALRRNASRGMCTDCGSYDDCPCDDMADQQATGGY